MQGCIPILVLSVQGTPLVDECRDDLCVPDHCGPVQGGLVPIILDIEVAASLQQNLDHRKMALIGSKMQGSPAMLGNCYLGALVDELNHILCLAFVRSYEKAL